MIEPIINSQPVSRKQSFVYDESLETAHRMDAKETIDYNDNDAIEVEGDGTNPSQQVSPNNLASKRSGEDGLFQASKIISEEQEILSDVKHF